MKRIFGVVVLFTLSFSASSQDSPRPKQPDLPGDIMIDFGFNFFNESPDLLPTRAWGSNSFGIYYNHRIRFNDYISFHPSIGYTAEKYAFDSNWTWLNGANGVPQLDTLSGRVPLEKNKLVVGYFEIPIEFRIHPFSTVEGEGFFIGLGAVAGIRAGVHTKLKYNLGENSVKEKLYDDFGVNQFRYGVQARLGFKSVHLFYKMYLNNLFTAAPDASGVNPNTFTAGITFSGF